MYPVILSLATLRLRKFPSKGTFPTHNKNTRALSFLIIKTFNKLVSLTSLFPDFMAWQPRTRTARAIVEALLAAFADNYFLP